MTVSIGDSTYTISASTTMQAGMLAMREHLTTQYCDVLPTQVDVDGEEIDTSVLIGLICEFNIMAEFSTDNALTYLIFLTM